MKTVWSFSFEGTCCLYIVNDAAFELHLEAKFPTSTGKTQKKTPP